MSTCRWGLSGIKKERMRSLPGWKWWKSAIVPALLVVMWAGCSGGGGGGATSGAGVQPRTARVTWLGNQCFLITSGIGTEILVNPFAPGTNGRKLPGSLTPDILLVTHERRDANYDPAVENYPATFRGGVGAGLNNSGGIRIRGTPTGAAAGTMNLVFSWTVDGMRFCFPGDLAAQLSSADLTQIGRVDILFLPVSGKLGPQGREQLIAQLQPRVIIPMGTSSAVETWASGFENAHRIGGSSVLLNQYALPARPIALVLTPQ